MLYPSMQAECGNDSLMWLRKCSIFENSNGNNMEIKKRVKSDTFSRINELHFESM